jgi:hypothetical protein
MSFVVMFFLLREPGIFLIGNAAAIPFGHPWPDCRCSAYAAVQHSINRHVIAVHAEVNRHKVAVRQSAEISMA